MRIAVDGTDRGVAKGSEIDAAQHAHEVRESPPGEAAGSTVLELRDRALRDARKLAEGRLAQGEVMPAALHRLADQLSTVADGGVVDPRSVFAPSHPWMMVAVSFLGLTSAAARSLARPRYSDECNAYFTTGPPPRTRAVRSSG